MKKSIVVFFILYWLGALPGFSQSIQFSASAEPTEVAINDIVNVSYDVLSDQINFHKPDIKFPAFSGFEILGRSYMTSVSRKNGINQFSQHTSFRLKAQKAGTIIISPATLTEKGKIYKTKPIKIKVNEHTQTGGSIQYSSGSRGETFLEASLSNNTPYLNQSIIATVRLYTKDYNILQQAILQRENLMSPNFTNFFAYKVEHIASDAKEVNIDGEVYLSLDMAKYILFPIQVGEQEISSFSFIIAEPVDFFETKDVKLSSIPVSINTKPLPANAPPSFTGAVGEFKYHVINNGYDKKNHNLSLQIIISGSGNLKTIKIPEPIINRRDFQVYPPIKQESILLNDHGMHGKIEDTYTLVANNKGLHRIQCNEFSYFDPQKEKYETIQPPPIQVNIEHLTYNNRENSIDNTTGSSIRKTENSSVFSKTKKYFIWGAAILAVLMGATLAWYFKKRDSSISVKEVQSNITSKPLNKESLSSNGSSKKNHSSMGVIIEKLNRCRYYMEQGNEESFLSAQESLLRELAQLESPIKIEIESRIDNLTKALNFVKYSPVKKKIDLQEIYKEMEKLIEDFLKTLKQDKQ